MVSGSKTSLEPSPLLWSRRRLHKVQVCQTSTSCADVTGRPQQLKSFNFKQAQIHPQVLAAAGQVVRDSQSWQQPVK